MKSEDEPAELVKRQIPWFVRTVQMPRTEEGACGGGEYAKGSRNLEAQGIEVHGTGLHTLQKNRRAEWMNCIFENGVQMLLIQSRAP